MPRDGQQCRAPGALPGGSESAGLTAVRYGSLELIGGLADGYLLVWWLATGDVLQRMKAHRGPIHDLQFDATRVVSAGGDALVVVTDITTGEQIQSLRGHDGPVRALRGSADGSMLATCSSETTRIRWRNRNYLLQTCTPHRHG